MMRALAALGLLTLISSTSLAQSQIRNIRLGRPVSGWGQSLNPVVALNHKNHNNVAIRFAPHQGFYSMDAGNSWLASVSDSTHITEVELIADPRGNFYSFFFTEAAGSLAGTGGIVDKESADEGKTWIAGTQPVDTRGVSAFRPQGSAHFTRGMLYLSWTGFDSQRNGDSTCQSNVFFSYSNERKWSEPVRINQGPGLCTNEGGAVWATSPVISLEGRLFVSWFREGNIYFDRSYDAGKTWLTNDIVIGANRKGLGMNIPGVCRIAGSPSLAVDNSQSFFRSSLYLVWSDQTSGDNDSDIWFLRSTNRGDLWSLPVRVNQDGPGKHQFCPWISVDNATGIIYIVYYDRREHDDLMTDVYLAVSVDGGHQFKEKKISETPFMTSGERMLCDHPEVSAGNGIIALTWTRLDDEGSSVWTTVLKQEELIKNEDVPKLQHVRKN